MKAKVWISRTEEYRRALASLPDEHVGTALACYVFSSLPQKERFCAALRKIEDQPGFAGWGEFQPHCGPGPVVRVSRSVPRRGRAAGRTKPVVAQFAVPAGSKSRRVKVRIDGSASTVCPPRGRPGGRGARGA